MQSFLNMYQFIFAFIIALNTYKIQYLIGFLVNEQSLLKNPQPFSFDDWRFSYINYITICINIQFFCKKLSVFCRFLFEISELKFYISPAMTTLATSPANVEIIAPASVQRVLVTFAAMKYTDIV